MGMAFIVLILWSFTILLSTLRARDDRHKESKEERKIGKSWTKEWKEEKKRKKNRNERRKLNRKWWKDVVKIMLTLIERGKKRVYTKKKNNRKFVILLLLISNELDGWMDRKSNQFSQIKVKVKGS